MNSAHDAHHHDCPTASASAVEDRLAAAMRLCQNNGVRLTDQRRMVLELLAVANRALGAYDIMEIMASRTAKRVAPVSVYRALDFLLEQKLIHRIESRNAYLACPHMHERHEMAVFMICEECGDVREATSSPLEAQLKVLANQHGFHPRGQIIEMAGRCAGCAEKP